MALTDGIQPVMNVGDGYGGFGGGCWVWILVLFFLMNGGGFWGNRNNNAMDLMQGQQRIEKAVYDSNNNQTIGDQIRGITYGIADSTYALNNTINGVAASLTRDNFGMQKDILLGHGNIQRDIAGVGYQAQIQGLTNTNNLGQAINQNRFDMATGLCNTNHNIDNLRFDNALNTNRITDNNMILTQKVLDRIDRMEANAKDNEIANLRQQLSMANLAVSQRDQNAQLFSVLRPYPNPAYIVGNPVVSNLCPCAA